MYAFEVQQSCRSANLTQINALFCAPLKTFPPYYCQRQVTTINRRKPLEVISLASSNMVNGMAMYFVANAVFIKAQHWLQSCGKPPSDGEDNTAEEQPPKAEAFDKTATDESAAHSQAPTGASA